MAPLPTSLTVSLGANRCTFSGGSKCYYIAPDRCSCHEKDCSAADLNISSYPSILAALQHIACYIFTVSCMSKLHDDRRRPIESTPAVTIRFSKPTCCTRFFHKSFSTLLGISGQTGLHEVNTTIHDASVTDSVEVDSAE